MRIEQVTVNASPLIALFRSGQAELLPRLFQRVYVPNAVWREVTDERHLDAASRGIVDADWLLRVDVDDIPEAVRMWNLGAGESAVLAHAIQNSGCRAVIDDLEARRCAETLHIATLGTGGILVLAKKRGLIASVSDGALALRKAGLRISDEVIALLMAHAGE